MTINLHKINIELSGPLARDAKITDENGNKIEGITELTVRLRADSLADVTLEIQGIQGLNLRAQTANLEIDDHTLVQELLTRGYKVTLDDTDIEEELHQSDEHQDQSQELPGDRGRED